MSKVVALDIETTGLDPWRDDILMVGLYKDGEYNCYRSREQLCSYLNEFYGHDLVCHNAQFDIKFLEVKGWWKPDGRVVHDTKVMASLLKSKVPKTFLEQYEEDRKILNKEIKENNKSERKLAKREKRDSRLLHELRPASGNSLKVLAPYYLQVPRFWETGNFNDEEYNRKDCQYTYDLFQLFEPKLREEGSWEFYERMLQWSEMVRTMETRGINIDSYSLYDAEEIFASDAKELHEQMVSNWSKYTEEYRALRATVLNKTVEKIPSFNFNSIPQMKWLLKEKLGLDIADLEHGEDTTDKAVLQRLISEGRKDVETFFEWKKTQKILTAYLPSYKELAREGTIHTSFNLTGTRTGRTSSASPNLQQVPPSLYSLFKPRTGYKFVQYDLSGIEAALIALYSGDQKLYEILEKGESIHDHNAKALFQLSCSVGEVAERHAKERKCAKTIGFACFYGAGAKRIKTAFQAAGFTITSVEAKQKLQLLKSYYPRAFEFHREVTRVFESGETVYNLLGRPVTIQPWENPYMQGFNSLIQSSASDLNLEACYRYWNHHGGNPLLVIHDCILAEEPAEHAEFMANNLRYCMTTWKLESKHGPIHLKVEGGVSDAWEK